MFVLRSVDGPSSETLTFDEMRDAVDARGLSVGTEDFRERYEVVEVRVDARPGISKIDRKGQAWEIGSTLLYSFFSCCRIAEWMFWETKR